MSHSLCLLKTLLMFTLLDLVFMATSTTVPQPTETEESKVKNIEGKLTTEPFKKENDVGETSTSLSPTTQKLTKKPGSTTVAPSVTNTTKGSTLTNTTTSNPTSTITSYPIRTTTSYPTSTTTYYPTSTTTSHPTSTTSHTIPKNNITTPRIQSTTIINDASINNKSKITAKVNEIPPEVTTVTSSTTSRKTIESENISTILPANVNRTSTPINDTSFHGSDTRSTLPAISDTTPTLPTTLISKGTTPSPIIKPATSTKKIAEEKSSSQIPHQNGTLPPTESPDSSYSEESANGLSARALPVAVSSLLLMLIVRAVA